MPTDMKLNAEGVVSPVARYQANIDGKVIARMIMDFHTELSRSYGEPVMTSDLCAVGPLQAMIGLAIERGYLAAIDNSKPTPTAVERRAPVQGYSAGIPWSMHLRAYDAYCKKYSPQLALIQGGCRGGFGTNELDMFIPGWRDELSALAAAHSQHEADVAMIGDLGQERDEAYQDGYDDGKSEWDGVKAQLWNAIQHWLELRHGLLPDADGFTIEQLLDGLHEVEAENKSLRYRLSKSALAKVKP